jgi:hypothetical protein
VLYRLYYQSDPQRVGLCLITVHALLHVAPGIRKGGPVWAYWEYAMERFCGRLLPAIKSRRYPWSSLDSFVVTTAQLTVVSLNYNVAEMLQLRAPSRSTAPNVVHPEYCMCFLLSIAIVTD